jgi:hypothetical protein
MIDDKKDITICLYAGEGRENIVRFHTERLKPLEEIYNVHWNNRIDRHPGTYDSYSQMVNESIVTSPTERILLVSDRVVPTAEEAVESFELLESGFAMAGMWGIAYMAVTKELFRRVGWFDERFLGGGFEDDDYTLRMKIADVAVYESIHSNYDFSWRPPRKDGHAACAASEPHFHRKWHIMNDYIAKVIPEETYDTYNNQVGEPRLDISSRWMSSKDSRYGVEYDNVQKRLSGAGASRSQWFLLNCQTEYRKVLSA